MSLLPQLDQLDSDGAIREYADKVDPATRAVFLRKVGIGAGAVVAGGAFAGSFPALGRAATPKSDVDILNFALTLEFLEAEFYTLAVNSNFPNPEHRLFAQVVKAHEVAHVKALQGALGPAAVKKPKFDFGDATTDQGKFAGTAQVLEDTGVAAYLGQVGNIKSKAVLAAAGSILPVEARHAAWIRDINGGKPPATNPAPAAFEKGKTKAQILAAVAPYIVS